ncbi:hypothetical protein [uncultured Microbulbifer sp.]|uniref:hypothetical protein n=1 Tax=uncultured Microbulbifer sp. TaxID=348147 RepID=UPI002601031E|nr:hypothetical protein [uncultured Microbulbifer sp.]
MAEGISLFDEIKKGGYTSCLLSTFNVDLSFYENVLLPKMRSAGIDHQALFVDQGMLHQALEDYTPQSAGLTYSLAPMNCGGAFHPKLLLLLGKNKGLLAVGSHNVTLSGFGRNLEITNVVRFKRGENEQSLSLFHSAFRAFLTWLEDYGAALPREIAASINKVPKLVSWLKPSSATAMPGMQLVWSSASTGSLWSQVASEIPKEDLRIYGVSAFFDKQLGFVDALAALQPLSFHLGIQQRFVKAPKGLLDTGSARVVEASSVLLPSDEQNRYSHAKLLYLQGSARSCLISGSANLSAPAWLRSGVNSNAEAVLVRQDQDIDDIAQSLGLPRLADAPLVDSLDHPLEQESESQEASAVICVLPVLGGEDISIPRAPEWGDHLSLGFFDSNEVWQSLDFKLVADAILVPAERVLGQSLIQVRVEGKLVATILLHHVREIERLSHTGLERKVRQAMGSIDTDAIDLGMIFDCISQLEENDIRGGNRVATLAREAGVVATGEAEVPGSLLADLDGPGGNAGQIRSRLNVADDVGLILDVLIRTCDESSFFAERSSIEDKFGRSEEEAVNADDDLAPVDSIGVEETRLNCVKRFDRAIAKLKKSLDGETKRGLSSALGLAMFMQRVVQAKGEDWVSPTACRDLLAELCRNFLRDNDEFFSAASDESVFTTREWSRFVGVLGWLAYVAGIRLRSRLPLSAQLEDKAVVRWENACWLYIAQRIREDQMARETASSIVYASGDEGIKQWFEALLNFDGKSLLSSLTGFDLASSPSGAFPGYRLVTEGEEELHLAKVAGPGEISRFRADRLCLVADVMELTEPA